MTDFKVQATADKLLEAAADVIYEIVTPELLIEVATKVVKTSSTEFITEGSIAYLKILSKTFDESKVEEYKDSIRSIIGNIALSINPVKKDDLYTAAVSGLCYLASCVFLDAACILGFTATVSKFVDIVKHTPNHIFMMIAMATIKRASTKELVTWPLLLTDEDIRTNIIGKKTTKEHGEVYAMMKTNKA
jgi:hypothetical protein